MFFDVFAFIVFALLGTAVVVAIVALGSLPGNIARKRNHPQADAIAAAGWIGVASLGVLWPIAFVWAFTRSGSTTRSQPDADLETRLAALEATVGKLEDQIERESQRGGDRI